MELSGPTRQELGEAIARFHAALEALDEREIVPVREELLAMTTMLKRR